MISSLESCVFQDFPAIIEDLDLVEEEDQFTHLITLEDAGNPEDILSMCLHYRLVKYVSSSVVGEFVLLISIGKYMVS